MKDDNILSVSMWAVVRPASTSYINQPAYRVLPHTIAAKKSTSIASRVGGMSWRTAKRYGFKCVRVSVLGSSEYSRLVLKDMGDR